MHSVTQRPGALKEDEAMKLRGIQVPTQSPNQLNEKKAVKETIKPTTPSEAKRRDGSQPITPSWEVTACSPMYKQCADHWRVLQHSGTMSSDTAEDLKIAMRTEGQVRR